jgi:hypothetical protein
MSKVRRNVYSFILVDFVKVFMYIFICIKTAKIIPSEFFLNYYCHTESSAFMFSFKTEFCLVFVGLLLLSLSNLAVLVYMLKIF